MGRKSQVDRCAGSLSPVFKKNEAKVFELTDFNKKHKSISMKPFNFACVLKMSKAQMQEKSFKDGLIDQIYELLLDSFNVHSSSIGFPEMALPAILQLKDFLKKCKVANYCKQIKQILEKVEENNKFIIQKRRSVSFNLADTQSIDTWERKCKESGTPLSKYYATWRKLKDRELQHEISGKERISDFDIPTIKRPTAPKATKEERKEFAAMFESDSDESMDDEERFLTKEERTKKRPKPSKEDDLSSDNEYSDFDSDELKELADSADEDVESSESEDHSAEVSKGSVEEEDDEEEDEQDSDQDLTGNEDIVKDFQLSDSD